MKYLEQIERIQEKLVRLKEKDTEYKIFGSQHHKYQLNPPIPLQEVQKIEQQYQISLPDDYKAFITQVGNGGIGFQNQGAGPYYGIYPLDISLRHSSWSVIQSDRLKNEVLIFPEMSEAYWNDLVAYENTELSDKELDKLMDKALGGILYLGDQGCANYHALVLNGKEKGRVVNLISDDLKPHFCYEANFLDWYERWLNEGLDGELFKAVVWFGYNKAKRTTL